MILTLGHKQISTMFSLGLKSIK